MKGSIIVAAFCGAGHLCSGAVDFSRYALILERRPFSSPVVEEVAPPPVTVAAPPAFVKELRMVAMTESPAGIRVGFINIKANPPKPYYLYVGDDEDGILLAEADYDAEKALLRKNGEQFWVTMGDGTGDSSPPPSATKISAQANRSPRSTEGGGLSAPLWASVSENSYAERRRLRLEEMQRRAQESRNLSEEEVEKQLREYQMKLIREGKTPLPIPITEEMDAQLVKEGILPPVK